MRPLAQVYWEGYGISSPYTGIGRYARSIAEHLDPDALQVQILNDGPTLNGLSGLPTSVASVDMNQDSWWCGVPKLCHPLRSASYLRRHHGSGPAVLHGLSNLNLPIWRQALPKGIRTVLTVHDLIPLVDSRAASRAYRWQLRLALRQLSRYVDRFLCVSTWTRDCLEELFPQCRSRVTVIPNGVGALVPRSSEDVTLSARTRLLCVSRWEPYKNWSVLWELLRLNPKYDLHLVTNAEGLVRVPKSLLHGDDGQQRLRVSTALSEVELADAYRDCDVYVHPSLYEGFCLPAYEALARRRPVVFKLGHALDDLGGLGLGKGVTLQKPDAWSAAIERAKLLSSSPSFHDNLERYWLKCFSWADTAEAIVRCYRELL